MAQLVVSVPHVSMLGLPRGYAAFEFHTSFTLLNRIVQVDDLGSRTRAR